MNLDTIMESRILRIIFSGIVTFFLSIGISLHGESHNVTKLRGWLLQILPVAFGGFFYLGFTASMQNERNIILFSLTLTGMLAYLFIAPFIRHLFSKDSGQSTYYTYFYNTSIVFLTSFIFWGVLSFLWDVAIWAVFSLFDLKDILSFKIYTDWIILACSFLAPIFALTQLPTRESFLENHFNENAFFSFLVKYIAIPFITLYFIILYSYSAKVLANFSQWPKGEVSWLVIGFSIFGYIIYIFSYIFEEKNTFIRLFRKFFPGVVVPQLFMLFYAIYLRIAQYDITMNRYFVVVFGIWLTAISLYLLFSKRRYLVMLPALLTLFTLVISVGPWSVYELPMARQQVRLEKNLVKAHILQDGKIVPLKTYGDINRDLSKEIYEGINYLCDFDDCDTIKTIFPDQYGKIASDHRLEFDTQKKEDLERAREEKEKKTINERVYQSPDKWLVVSKLAEMVRVQTYYGDNSSESVVYFSLANDEHIFPIDTRGYTKILLINDGKSSSKNTAMRVEYDEKNNTLNIKEGEKVIDTISLQKKVSELLETYKKTRELQLTVKDMTYESGKYRVILENLQSKNPEYTWDDTNMYRYINGYILVK